MREGIHPEYVESTVQCACGFTFKTRSTQPAIRVEICSHCHPFYTGKQKLLDTAGRVERFQKRFAKTDGKTVIIKKEVKPVVKKARGKILSTSPRRAILQTKKEAAKGAKVIEKKKEK
ncbi:MAG: 50S ribosomal protein L31 [Endomicrobiales bacterium]|jgi:large subunit ribosomal protein L31